MGQNLTHNKNNRTWSSESCNQENLPETTRITELGPISVANKRTVWYKRKKTDTR